MEIKFICVHIHIYFRFWQRNYHHNNNQGQLSYNWDERINEERGDHDDGYSRIFDIVPPKGDDAENAAYFYISGKSQIPIED